MKKRELLLRCIYDVVAPSLVCEPEPKVSDEELIKAMQKFYSLPAPDQNVFSKSYELWEKAREQLRAEALALLKKLIQESKK